VKLALLIIPWLSQLALDILAGIRIRVAFQEISPMLGLYLITFKAMAQPNLDLNL
jgi:hypothetical protein